MDQVSFSTFFILALIGFIMYFLDRYIYRIYKWKKYYESKNAKFFFIKVPIFGNRTFWMDQIIQHRDVCSYIKRTVQTNPETPMIVMNVGSQLSILITDPPLQKLFLQQQEKFHKADSLQILKFFMGNGLITAEGSTWRRHRKIISKAFHFEFINQICPEIAEFAYCRLCYWRKARRINLLQAFSLITSDVVGKLFFGDEFQKQKFDGQPLAVSLTSLISEILQYTYSTENMLLGSKFILKGILPKHRSLVQRCLRFRALCRDIIQNYRKNEKSKPKNSNATKNLLDILFQHQEENQNDGDNLTDEDIIDEFLTFFSAGTDTLAHLLTMAVFHLGKYPEYEERLVQEAIEYLDNLELINTETLNKMEFTTAFLKETLRMTPPAISLIIRKSVETLNLGGFIIPKGHLVNVGGIANNYNPKIFRQPNRFNPNRWIEGHVDYDMDPKKDPFKFIPFSQGPRNCIGNHFAMNEARIVLGIFLMMYKPKFLCDVNNMRMVMRTLYETETPIFISVSPRDEPFSATF